MSSLSVQTVKAKPNRSLRLPNIYVILIVLMFLAALLTWLVPAGSYDRILLDSGREMVVAGSYQQLPQSPVDFITLLTAIPIGLSEASGIVFLTLLVGGSVGVMKRNGVVQIGITQLLKAVGRRQELIIPSLMFFFSITSAFIGTPELSLAYLPIILPLMIKMGYDSITAVALVLLSTTLGFAFGITVPGTIGIGHILSDLPMFSGAWYRIIFFVVIQISAMAFVMNYARKIRHNPELGINYEEDIKIRQEFCSQQKEASPSFTHRQYVSSIITFALFIITIVSILVFNFGFNEISGLFLGMAITSSLIAGKNTNEICADFNESFREILVGAIICGVARGVSVLLVEGNIMDTMVYGLANLIESLPEAVTAVGIFFAQTTFNFLVPSGSGQTMLTLPILIPLADLVGVTRQVVVLASHWGDGITNIVFPTSGYFIAALAVGRVSLSNWLKFYWPMFCFVLLVAVVGLVIAQNIVLGPF